MSYVLRVRVDHLGLLKPFSWMGSACKGDLGFGGETEKGKCDTKAPVARLLDSSWVGWQDVGLLPLGLCLPWCFSGMACIDEGLLHVRAGGVTLPRIAP